MSILVKLPDLPIQKGLIAYFDDHEEDLAKLNAKQAVVVPDYLLKEMRQYAIVNLLGRAPDPIEEKSPSLEMENPNMPEATDASQPEESENELIIETLMDKLLCIDGIGKTTAQKVFDFCNGDLEILKMKLKNDDVNLREDYVLKLKNAFLVEETLQDN